MLTAAPDQGDALHLAGIVAFRRGDPADALALMERSIALGIDTRALPAQHLRGLPRARPAGRGVGRRQRAVALAPDDPLCLHNLGDHPLPPHGTRRRARLRPSTRCAINPGLPGAHFVRPRRCCCAASWKEGWQEYEWRFRIGGAAPLMPPTDKPQWDGTPFADGARCC